VHISTDSELTMSHVTALGCHAGYGGFLSQSDGNVTITDTTVSSYSSLDGGAIYATFGKAILSRTDVGDCHAGRTGGAIHSGGGTLLMSDGTSLHGNTAGSIGGTLYVSGGSLSYILPTPPGHWMPNARCVIFRTGCPYGENTVRQARCLAHRADCELQLEGNSSWLCPPLSFTQPCNWDDSSGGDVTLLGRHLYQLPSLPMETDLPYACSAGLVGSAEPVDQTSSSCGGACPARFLCPQQATTEPVPCPTGSYCPQGSVLPLSCPAGTFSNTTGLASPTECEPCPAGHSCPVGATQPVPCTSGTFSPAEGLAACVSCPIGSAAPLGSTLCTRCASGEYAASVGQGECVPCPHPLSSQEGSDMCGSVPIRLLPARRQRRIPRHLQPP
jgi:hypothetical protein